MKKIIHIFLASAAFVLIAYQNPGLQAIEPNTVKNNNSKQTLNQDWHEFHSVAGKCSLKFPKSPEHVTEKMSVPDEGYDLKYDAYISNIDKKNVFLLLIAEYPEFVDQSFAKVSLEGFLNGILAHNPNNQLLFADLLLVNGYEALDFFIRSGGIYFKGRAIMVKNKLYLLAMECEVQNYDEGRYNYFVNSFHFKD
ncbi:MAG: hypothetical protein L0207_05725 [Chlamydiae bacterium]|nr:hypothetical protein [Chlamydiota bacterium]